jgi:hypothetical protein
MGESKLGGFVRISMGERNNQEEIQRQTSPQEKSIIMASKLI